MWQLVSFWGVKIHFYCLNIYCGSSVVGHFTWTYWVFTFSNLSVSSSFELFLISLHNNITLLAPLNWLKKWSSFERMSARGVKVPLEFQVVHLGTFFTLPQWSLSVLSNPQKYQCDSMGLHEFFHHSAIVSCITFHVWKSVDCYFSNKVFRDILRFFKYIGIP